jgi:hypothetical protein
MPTPEHFRALRLDRIARGVCPSCGAHPLAKGRKLCLGCCATATMRAGRLRLSRLTRGLCAYCGRRPHMRDRQGCRECLTTMTKKKGAKK